MLRFCSGARARAFVLVVLAVVASLLLATPAGADVSPTGTTEVSVHVTFKFSVFASPAQLDVDATFTGTVDKKGALEFPSSGISIDPALNQTWVNGEVIVPKVQLTAPSDWHGAIDPASGLVTLSGPLVVTSTVTKPAPAPACPLPAVTLNLSTKKAGGKAYDPKTSTATVTDNEYSIPALPEDPPGQVAGCNKLEVIFNQALDLPTAPGASSAAITLSFEHTLEGSGTTTPVTTKGTTVPVTAAATSTTTVAAPANQLPRTGSSSVPLAIFGAGCVAAGGVLVGRRRVAR